MSHPSKRKGTKYEREIVNTINDHPDTCGVIAERAYGSNGKALGKSEECDILIQRFEPGQLGFIGDEWTVQAKRRARVAGYIKPPEGIDMTMVREDRGETLVVMTLPTFLDMLIKLQSK